MSIKYKIGDKVILKTLEEIEKTCEYETIHKAPGLTYEMKKLLGTEVTISGFPYSDRFRIEELALYKWHPTWIDDKKTIWLPSQCLLEKELFTI
jgi:hypothetical protein